jgi:septal ring-binding cell division protein DamX
MNGRLRYGLLTALIILGGCGQSPVASQANNVAWHCEEVKGSREPRCEQRQLINGRPAAEANDVDAEAEKKQISIKSPASQKPREIILVGEHRPRFWREQLPGLSLDKPSETAPPKPGAYRDGPTPVPEAAFTEDKGEDSLDTDTDTDTETKQSDTLLDNKNITAASLIVSSEPHMEANRDENIIQNPVSVSTGSGDAQGGEAFTVQLGAFNSEAAAEQFIQTNHLAHLIIERQVLNKAGQSWHVLTFGDFADKQRAGKAWLAAAENAEEIEVWIRPVQP